MVSWNAAVSKSLFSTCLSFFKSSKYPIHMLQHAFSLSIVRNWFSVTVIASINFLLYAIFTLEISFSNSHFRFCVYLYYAKLCRVWIREKKRKQKKNRNELQSRSSNFFRKAGMIEWALQKLKWVNQRLKEWLRWPHVSCGRSAVLWYHSTWYKMYLKTVKIVWRCIQEASSTPPASTQW